VKIPFADLKINYSDIKFSPVWFELWTKGLEKLHMWSYSRCSYLIQVSLVIQCGFWDYGRSKFGYFHYCCYSFFTKLLALPYKLC